VPNKRRRRDRVTGILVYERFEGFGRDLALADCVIMLAQLKEQVAGRRLVEPRRQIADLCDQPGARLRRLARMREDRL
jgi:hypothetical protein